MKIKLCSACLLGISCRYDGGNSSNQKVLKMAKEEVLIPVCPEQLGGLPTPRDPAGIFGGLGKAVLEKRARVRTVDEGKDLSSYFIKGAKEVLRISKLFAIKEAILKQRSPSCGSSETWQLDKYLKNHVVNGDGVTAALLKKNQVNVISEEDL